MTTESGGQRELTTKELREMSRQMYLPKRAEKELKLLEAQLQDEEDLFLKEGEGWEEEGGRRGEEGGIGVERGKVKID